MNGPNHYVENFHRFRSEITGATDLTASQWTQLALRVKKARMDRQITSHQEQRLLAIIRERSDEHDGEDQ